MRGNIYVLFGDKVHESAKVAAVHRMQTYLVGLFGLELFEDLLRLKFACAHDCNWISPRDEEDIKSRAARGQIWIVWVVGVSDFLVGVLEQGPFGFSRLSHWETSRLHAIPILAVSLSPYFIHARA